MDAATPPLYLRPQTPEEALALKQAHAGAAWVGGGTLVMGSMLGPRPHVLVDLCDAGLGGVSDVDGRLRIGATTPIDALGREPQLGSPGFGAILDVARGFSPRTLRRIATVGGNLCTGIGSLLAPFLLFDAEVEQLGAAGRAASPLSWFVPTGENLVLAVRLAKLPPGARSGWAKAQRTPVGPAVVAVAAAVDGESVRLATASATFPARRLPAVERQSAGLTPDEVAALVPAALPDAFDDPRGSAGYRRAMAAELTRRLLTRLRAEEAAHA